MTGDLRPSVLIADDAQAMRDTVRQLVTEILGYEVVGLAVDGLDAIRLFKEKKPELVLLDISMPGMSGIEVLKSMLAHCSDVVVIMLTSAEGHETVEKCLSLGAAAYLTKSTPLAEMKRVIEDTWSRHQVPCSNDPAQSL